MHSITTPIPTQAHTGTSPTMPFGKYKSAPLEDLPSEYLLWLGCLNDLRQPLLGHVLKEMARRLMELEQQTAPDREAVSR